MAARHWESKELNNLGLIPDFLLLLDFMEEGHILLMTHSSVTDLLIYIRLLSADKCSL